MEQSTTLQDSDTHHQRAHWGATTEYYLAAIGFAVGYGSVWRFPYLLYENGGGAFLVPYFICLFLVAIPFFYLESGVGQVLQLGVCKSFTYVRKGFRGVGIACLIINFFEAAYYNMFLAYSLIFLWDSFSWTLPWKVENPVNGKYWDESYFYDKVLEISPGITELGGFNPRVIIAVTVSFICLYLCTMKGIQTSGKVEYVSAPAPYFILFVLLFRGLFLDGAFDGIYYMFKVDWTKIWNVEIWAKAAGQVLFQISLGQGSLMLLASYKDKTSPLLRPSIFLPSITAATGILCGVTVFSYMGHMAFVANKGIHELPLTGPELVFVAYPAALTLIPGSSFWSVLFFLMMFFLGLDSEFTFLETINSYFEDEEIKVFGRKWEVEKMGIIVVILVFLAGTVLYTRGGFYYIPFYDSYTCNVPLMVSTALQSLIFCWIYGWEKLQVKIKECVNETTPPVFIFATTYLVIPILTFLASAALYEEIIELFTLPWWFAIGGFLLTALPLSAMGYFYWKYKDEPGDMEEEDMKAPLIELREVMSH